MSKTTDEADPHTGPGLSAGIETGSISPEDYIAAIPMWTKKKNSLADIREFLSALNVSEKNIIHVAGTNGKGSVCAYLTSIFNASGFTTGTFVSPHLCDVKERFLINGTPVGEADLREAFDRVLSVVNEKCREGFAHPSYFEFCFLIAMTLFTEKDVDFRILETGLGGRLDATNSVSNALVCVITSISLDHTQYLGNTIEEIAAEKAGIIKPGVPVIYDAADAAAARVIEDMAFKRHSRAYPVCGDIPETCETSVYPESLPDFPAPYQKMNAALALKTVEILGIPGITRETVYAGLSSLNWQGRMEEIIPGIWLDGAHNPGGTKAFIEAVKDQQRTFGPFEVHLLFAVSGDKDYPLMIHLLSEELSPVHVTVTAYEGERAADGEELCRLFKEEGVSDVRAVTDPEAALRSAIEELRSSRRQGSARLFITGSLYLIGALRQCLI